MDASSRERGEGRRSVREELKEIREEQNAQKTSGTKEHTPEKSQMHVAPPTKTPKVKEVR